MNGWRFYYYYFDQNGNLAQELINQAQKDPDTGYLGEDLVRTEDDLLYTLDESIALQVFDLENIDWLFDYASHRLF